MSSTGAARDQWMAKLGEVQVSMARHVAGGAVPSAAAITSFRPVAERILTSVIGPPPQLRWDGRMYGGLAVCVRHAGGWVEVIANPDTGSAYAIPLNPETADGMAEALISCAEAARHVRREGPEAAA